MDPNLVKIKTSHLEEIKQGRLGRVLSEAKDYLMFIHKHNFAAMNSEFKMFKQSLQS